MCDNYLYEDLKCWWKSYKMRFSRNAARARMLYFILKMKLVLYSNQHYTNTGCLSS